MDLGAYAKIDILEQVMKDNDIQIERLRGLRYMKYEELFSKEDFEQVVKDTALWKCSFLF